MKIRCLKDEGWFEQKKNGTIYLYLDNGEKVRITKYEVRRLNQLIDKKTEGE